MEVTGLDKSSDTLKAIVNTCDALKSFANFELTSPPPSDQELGASGQTPAGGSPNPSAPPVGQLRFSHNIFINLPDTTIVEVFNAIFKAMKENLLA